MSINETAIPAPVKQTERNLGIDALRIFAMLLIVMLHVFNRGGVTMQTGGLTTARGVLIYPLRALCMAGVNIYAVISGYVLVNARFRPARLFELWMQVVFIGLTECLIERFVLHMEVEPKLWLKAIMPVTHREYWYFNAYTGLFFLSPLINKGLRNLSRRSLLILIKMVFCVFCLGTVISVMSGYDCFHMSSGYTTNWLLIMYIFGACMKRTDYLRDTKAWKLCLTILLSLLACLGISALLTSTLIPDRLKESEWLTMSNWNGLVLNYLNPLLVIVSLCMLSLFMRFRPGKILSSVIRVLSPLTFGVFLIHVHNLGWTLLYCAFKWVGKIRALLIVPTLIAVTLAIFLACAGLDWLRAQLFRLLRVRRHCDRLETALRRIVGKWVKE